MSPIKRVEVRFSHRFKKDYFKANSKIRLIFDKRLQFFYLNQFYPQLNNHALIGKLDGYRSINISGDWRAIFSEYNIKDTKIIIFEILGTHSQLYR